MSLAWVVVADSSQARIFSVDKPTSSLEEIHTFNHPEGRLHQAIWSPTVPAETEMPEPAVTTWGMRLMPRMKRQSVLPPKWTKHWSVAVPTVGSTDST